MKDGAEWRRKKKRQKELKENESENKEQHQLSYSQAKRKDYKKKKKICKTQEYTRRVMQPSRAPWFVDEGGERRAKKKRYHTTTGNPDLEFLLICISQLSTGAVFFFYGQTAAVPFTFSSFFLSSSVWMKYQQLILWYSTLHSLHLINIYCNCILSWLSGWVYGRDEFCVTTATTPGLCTPPCSTQTSPGIVQRKGKWRRRRDVTYNPPFWCFYGLAETTWEGPVASFFFLSVICRGTHTLTTERETKISANDNMGAAAASPLFFVCIQFAKMCILHYTSSFYIIIASFNENLLNDVCQAS